MAKAKPKSAATRKRVCGKWQELDYVPSKEEKAAYKEKMGAVAKAQQQTSDKK